MTRFIPLLILISFLMSVPNYADISISGINEAQFIYRDAKDSLSTFFHNEANLRINYDNIEIGLSITANLPKYSQFDSVKDLSPTMIQYQAEKLYLATNLSGMRIRVGSFNDYFGNGIILRSYRDKTYEWDTTLNGLSTQIRSELATIKTLYGSLPNEIDDNKNDTVGGIDLTSTYLDNISFGFSLLSLNERRFDDRYRTRLVAGGRVGISYHSFDVAGEYAETKLYRNIAGTVKGQAIYGYANKYLGPLTMTLGYKKYSNFNYRMNDLPSLNSSEEPLSERVDPGYDEEGLLTGFQYYPSMTTSLSVTYSEAWNTGFDIRQSDLFIEGTKDFSSFLLGFEYSQFEALDKDRKEWFKEITPALTFDLDIFGRASHIRGQFKVENIKLNNAESTNYYPLLQYDIFFNKFSLSLNAETKIESIDDIRNDPPTWFGLEFTVRPFSHTEMKVFVGEEKGGKVCRSGQCFYTSPFQGLKINLTTRF